MNGDRIAIVGGGIGGLTLAIALQRKGHPVKVYEGNRKENQSRSFSWPSGSTARRKNPRL